MLLTSLAETSPCRICVLVLIQKVLCPITVILLKKFYRCVSLFCSHDFLPFLPLNAGVVGLGSDPEVPAGIMTVEGNGDIGQCSAS